MKKKILSMFIVTVFILGTIANCFAATTDRNSTQAKVVDKNQVRMQLFNKERSTQKGEKSLFTSFATNTSDLENVDESVENIPTTVDQSVLLNVYGNTLSVEEIAEREIATVMVKTYDKYGYMFGLGSGFIVSEDGKIVTNYHVIESAKEYSMSGIDVMTNTSRIKIVGANGTVYPVKDILAADKAHDIAVLQIDNVDKLPYLPLGDSEALKKGTPVAAIGSPLGVRGTVTSGHVSNRFSIGKYIKEVFDLGYYIEDDINFIQIDVHIAPGSSGGALFNMKGEVVGVTAASMYPAGNLNFAIPSSIVKQVLDKANTPKEVINYTKISNYLTNTARTYTVDGKEQVLDSVEAVRNLINDDSIALKLNINSYYFKEYMIIESNDYGSKLRQDMEAWMKNLASSTIMLACDKSVVGTVHYKGTVTDINPDTFYKNGIDVTYNTYEGCDYWWWWWDNSYTVDFDLLYFASQNGYMSYRWWNDCCWFWWWW